MNWLPLHQYVPKAEAHPYLPSFKAKEIDRYIRYTASEYGLKAIMMMSQPERLRLVEALIPQLSSDAALWKSEVRQLLGVGADEGDDDECTLAHVRKVNR